MAVAVAATSMLMQGTVTGAQLAAMAPQASAVHTAGDIAGDWQGMLAWPAGANYPAGQTRVVLKIAREGDAGWSAQYFYIDQSGRPHVALDVRLQGNRLQYLMPTDDNGRFEGTVSPDGNSIVGRWISPTAQNPIIFARTKPETAWTIPPPPPHLSPMAADANPTFEVATIKPTGPEEHGSSLSFEGRRFSFIHASMDDLFDFAYGLQPRQILAAPGWVATERYDINAVSDGEGEPSGKQWQSMVKKLMADRFQLKFHYQKREFSVFALTVAAGGPKLKKSDPSVSVGLRGGSGNLRAASATMADFAQFLGHGFVDRPVVDQTGLTGTFDLSLRWTPDESHAAALSPDAPPGFFTAIQEQLGLKLVATKAPVDVLVIDHVERPSEN